MCGCGKKGVTRRAPTLRASVGPRSVKGGAAAAATPLELRTLGLQNAQSLTESRNVDVQRRRIEKLRRDAIKRKFGK